MKYISSCFFAVVLSPVMLVVSVQAEPEIKGGPEDLRRFLHPKEQMVSMSASAEQTAYSDTATVSLVFTTEEKLLSSALSKNSTLRSRVAKKLIAVGILEKNINSSKFSTSPQYGWFGSNPDSYKVINRMAVKIDAESQLKELALVADENLEISLSGTSFEHSKKEAFNQKVKQQALQKIMKQKLFYEKSLGVKLTPVNFREGPVARRATRGAVMLERAVMSASKSGRGSSDEPQQKPSYGSEKSTFDEVVYKADLHVDFKIEPIESTH